MTIYIENVQRFLQDRDCEHHIYVGRRSPLGNPFRLNGGTPGSTLPYYRYWLLQQITAGNLDVIQALVKIDKLNDGPEPVMLLCHCSPKPCHAEIIREAILDQWVYRCYKPQGIHRIGKCIGCNGEACVHCDDVGSGLLCLSCEP